MPAIDRAAATMRPWAALLLPPLAWLVYALGLAAALRLSCGAVGAGLGLGWGCASLAVCAGAAWLAGPLASPTDDQSPSRQWLARVALLASGIFALAIAFQTTATLMVPPCAR